MIFTSCKEGINEPLVELQQTRSVKRGVSYNFQIPDDANLLGPGVSWFYNWGTVVNDEVNTTTTANDIDFYPMAWNGNFNSAAIRAYKAIHPECEYILAYNEPNLTDQANMTPDQAAENWPALKAVATELGLKIISPAMNYGSLSGYGDPIKWLDDFFTKIPLSDVDGIAIHCYMSSASAMASYLKRFKKYGKPIWLTEFCAWDYSVKNVNAQMNYMIEAVSYLECDPDVARYAWFIPRASGSVDSYPFMQLLTKTTPYTLTDLGKVYVHMSSFDKNTYYPQGQIIEAEHFSSNNFEEAVLADSWSTTIHYRPTTDASGTLDVIDFNSDLWLEYLVDITETESTTLEVRYASLYNAKCQFSIDGTEITVVDLLKTNDENSWTTKSLNLSISKGKHILRIKNIYGGTSLNWIRISN